MSFEDKKIFFPFWIGNAYRAALGDGLEAVDLAEPVLPVWCVNIHFTTFTSFICLSQLGEALLITTNNPK